tara:strand:- start:1299 stop:6539 length:5241 start_codon:yes stop_codon:yes gene_type:complete
MSQNAEKLYSYLEENEPDINFGNFDEFSERLKDPNSAEELRNYLNQSNEIDFGDSATFYNELNEQSTQSSSLSNIDTSNISIKTLEQTGDDVLDSELKEKGSSENTLKNLNDPNYEVNQKVHSTDYGLFQINDSYHDQTSQEMFGKGVADLSPLENIELASVIAKNNYGPSNWVAYKKGAHKQFEGITDEDMVTDYGISPEIIDSINEEGKFSDPQLYKQILLAESAGKLNAVKINYTPQEDGKEVVPPEMLRDTQSVLQNLAQPEPMEASSTFTKEVPLEGFEDFKRTSEGLGREIQQVSEFLIKGATGQYGDLYETAEFEKLKEPVELATNILTHLAEFSAMPIDIATGLASNPKDVALGLIKFIPEEFNQLALATGTVDIINPFLGLAGKGYSQKELNSMRTKAQNHIFNTGGVYSFFAAHGLTSLGKKNTKIVEKNKQFSDVVEIANDRPPKNPVTKEQIQSAEALKKNPKLLEKAEQAVSEQLSLDFIEPVKVEKILKKAEKTKQKQVSISTELDLGRDVPVQKVATKEKVVSKNVKKVQEKVQKIKEKIEKKQTKQKTQSTEVNLERDMPSSTEIVQEIKLKTSKDLNKGKGIEPIKGEPAKRYKSKEKVDAFIEEKLADYVGQNIIARYGKTAKGDYLVKIFKKTKEQPLPSTATKPKPRDIKPDTTPEVLTKMRDPRISKRKIQNKDILAEKYELEISELNRNVSENIKELDLLNEQTLKTGIESPRVQLLKNSIDSANKTLIKAQKDLRLIMTSKQLLKRIANNISKRTAKGAVGRNLKKTQKEKIKEKLKNQELIEDIKQLWVNGETGLKMTKENLSKYLKSIGAESSTMRYARKNIKELTDEAYVNSAKELAKKIHEETPLNTPKVKGTKTSLRNPEEYFGNMRVEIHAGKKSDIKSLVDVDLLESVVNHIGGKEIAKAQGRTNREAIRLGAKTRKILAQTMHEVHHKGGAITIDNLSVKQTALTHLITTYLKEFGATQNKAWLPYLKQALLSWQHITSETGRTLGNLRELYGENIKDWKNYSSLFEDNPQILDILKRAFENKEIARSEWFKLTEWGRNAKLATGSSLVRSLGGNSFGMLDAYARMPFEYGWDFALRNLSKKIHELTNGEYGNLSKDQITRLELGAQVTGSFDGLRHVGPLLKDMFLENDKALRENAFFRREGLSHKDIKGFKGKVIRTPQRLQGMIDILFRVPMTSGYMKRNAVRQAIKEGKKTHSEIINRAIEIIENPDDLITPLKEQATQAGEYVTFQRELNSAIGVRGGLYNFLNNIRTGNTGTSAFAQMIVPFFNTAGNLFEFTLEHTPLHLFSKQTRQGFKEAFSPKGAGSRQLSTELSKITTGTGALYLLNRIFSENASGNITGDFSEDTKEERDMKTVNGINEYSIKTKDGVWVSYRGFEPLSSHLTLIESWQRTKNLKEMSDSDLKYAGEQLKSSIKSLGRGFLDNPFLTGTEDLFDALDSEDKFTNFMFKFSAGMLVPGIVRQINSIVSPYRTSRLKYTDINENVDFYEYLKSNAEQALPWLIPGQNLDALDPFGRIIPKPDPIGGLFAFRSTPEDNDPVYNEIQKIYFDTNTGFKPAGPLYTASEMAKIRLTPEEHWSLIAITGQSLYNFIKETIKQPLYLTMPSENDKSIRVESSPAYRRKYINMFQEELRPAIRKLLFAKQLYKMEKTLKLDEYYGKINNERDRKKRRKELRQEFERKSLNDLRKEANELIENAPEDSKLKRYSQNIPFLQQ